MRICRAALALLATLPLLAAGSINEFPHPKLVVQFHPKPDVPFELAHIDRALAAGVHGIELDVRLRHSDRTPVCSHSRKGLADRPTLAAAIDRILKYRGDSKTVQKDGLQFFIVLDIKEYSVVLEDRIVETLWGYADSWSTAAGTDGPRGITVIASGAAAGLTADSLFIVEGRDYRGRIRNVSAGGARFQWIAIQHPGERGRVRALHAGTDLAVRGAFNVRAYGCHEAMERCAAAGVDAMNADLEELPRAARIGP